jgi:hypothetical protein
MRTTTTQYDLALISKEGILAVLAFKSYFESKAVFGEWIDCDKWTIGSCVLEETASQFIEACYEQHFVQPFNWGEWVQSNRDLAIHGEGIENLNLEEIGKLLTAWCRGDRFSGGTLKEVMQSGMMLRVLNQLAEVGGL